MAGSGFTIIRYEPGTGLDPHIDQYFKSQGPLFLSSYGPKYNYYDMIPANTTKNRYTLRMEIPEGDIVIMEGSSRYEWLHSVPVNSTTSVRYAIVIVCYKYGPLHPFYSEIYNKHKFLTSPVPCI